MARPTSLTPELSKALVALIEKGMPIPTACDYEGINYSTVKRWMQRKDAPFAEFCAAIKRARATAKEPMIEEIRRGVENWQSRAWFLERSDPKNWGRKDRLEKIVKNAPKDGDGIEGLLRSVVDDPEMRDKLQAMLAGKAKEMH